MAGNVQSASSVQDFVIAVINNLSHRYHDKKIERLSMTFTANDKNETFVHLSSAPCTVKSKHLFLH